MVFAGIERSEAAQAVREEIESRRVTTPPALGPRPFSWRRWLRMPRSRSVMHRGIGSIDGGTKIQAQDVRFPR